MTGLGLTGGSLWVARNGLSGMQPRDTDQLPVRVKTLEAEGSSAGETPVPAPDTVTVVDLFATWCAPCDDQLEILNAIRPEYPAVSFLSVTNERPSETLTRADISQWWNRNGGAWTVGLDPGSELLAAFGADGLPYIAIVDESGTVQFGHSGLAGGGRCFGPNSTQWRKMAEVAVLGTLAFAASAGVATLFAPCAFPLLPGYVGCYLRESDGDVGMLPPATAATFGALGSLTLVALLVLALGQPLKNALPMLEPVIGVGLIVFGVVMLVNREPELRVPLPQRPASVTGFGVFGAVYAVAAAGCVVPLFFSVVTQALALPVQASVLVLTVYALGVALPLVGVTLLAGAGIGLWRTFGTYLQRMHQIAAIVMILAGGG
jgi:cytochrome c-type biogenesis protein